MLAIPQDCYAGELFTASEHRKYAMEKTKAEGELSSSVRKEIAVPPSLFRLHPRAFALTSATFA